MSGFFGNIDPNEIPDGPRAGVYDAVITGVEINKKSKKGGNFIVFEYTIGDPGFDFPVQDWFSFPEVMDPNQWDRTTPLNDKGETQFDINQRSMKWFKRRLMDFGVPREKVNLVTPDHLIGQAIKVTIEMNDQFPQVKSVAKAGAASGATLPTTPAPTAPSVASPQPSSPQPAFTPQASFQAPANPPVAPAAAPVAPPAGVNSLTNPAENPFAGMV